MLSWLIGGLTALLAAATPGTVEGSVQYDSTPVEMTHVVARETLPSPSGTQQPETVILITDREAPAEIAGSKQAYYAAAREGRIRGLLIVLDRSGQPPRLVMFANGGGTDQTAIPDVFNTLELTDFAQAQGFVSGRLRTTEPREFIDSPDGPQSYTLDLRFRAPVTPAPRPTETLIGEAARRSPQAAAALRALQLIHGGNLAEIRAQLLPDHPMWEALGGAGAQNVLRIARANLPQPATYLQSVQRVLVYGDEAVVLARDAEGDIDVSLRLADGVWKMAPSPIAND